MSAQLQMGPRGHGISCLGIQSFCLLAMPPDWATCLWASSLCLPIASFSRPPFSVLGLGFNFTHAHPPPTPPHTHSARATRGCCPCHASAVGPGPLPDAAAS